MRRHVLERFLWKILTKNFFCNCCSANFFQCGSGRTERAHTTVYHYPCQVSLCSSLFSSAHTHKNTQEENKKNKFSKIGFSTRIILYLNLIRIQEAPSTSPVLQHMRCISCALLFRPVHQQNTTKFALFPSKCCVFHHSSFYIICCFI